MSEDCEHKIASFELARDAARLQSELAATKSRIVELETEMEAHDIASGKAIRLLGDEQREHAATKARAEKAERERDEARGAIEETLRLADSLNEMAECGAGYHPHWGSRVIQAVEPLRNIPEFISETVAHNRLLLEANGERIAECETMRARAESAEKALAEAREEIERLKSKTVNGIAATLLRAEHDLASARAQLTVEVANNVVLREALKKTGCPMEPECHEMKCHRCAALSSPSPGAPFLAALQEAEKALVEVAKGEGPYDRNILNHATNCIEAMKTTAFAALSQIRALGLTGGGEG